MVYEFYRQHKDINHIKVLVEDEKQFGNDKKISSKR